MLTMIHQCSPAFHLLDDALLDLTSPPATIHRDPRPHLAETEESFQTHIVAPGVKSADLKVTVCHATGELKVQGTSKNLARGHRQRHINYAVTLPRHANLDETMVEHEDGIITITVPKKQAAEPTQLTPMTHVPQEDPADPSYNLLLSLPGLAASDLNISVHDDGKVEVSGETKRTGARVKRSYRVPRDADLPSAHACHVDGLLTISMCKRKRDDAQLCANVRHKMTAEAELPVEPGESQESTSAASAAPMEQAAP